MTVWLNNFIKWANQYLFAQLLILTGWAVATPRPPLAPPLVYKLNKLTRLEETLGRPNVAIHLTYHTLLVEFSTRA